MADNKGGSDLDVFEGLAKKPNRPSGFPAPASNPSARVPPPGTPLPSGPNSRPKTMLGMAPPPVGSVTPGVGSLPPPGGLPPVAPPPGRGSLPGALPPPGVLPLPGGARPGGVLPPVSAPPRSSGLPPLAPPPVSAPVQGKPAVDMDWDEEDEKTSIYDKDTTQEALGRLGPAPKPLPAAGLPAPRPAAGLPPPSQRPNLGAAAAMLAGSGGAAAPAPPPAMVPGPAARPGIAAAPLAAAAMPQPAVAQPNPAQAPSRGEPTQVVKAQGGGGKGAIIAVVGFAAVAALALGGWFLTQPKTGTLLVVAKSGGQNIEKVQISVDGKPAACTSSPCKIENLDKGAKTIKINSEGYKDATELASVVVGQEIVVNISMDKGGATSAASTAAANAATGFKASGPAHVKVSVDGKELGPLPQEVKDLAPGDHKIRFASSERYKADEKTITVKEGEMKDLGAVKLEVLKGRATLNLGTPGAAVMLVSGAEKRRVNSFPISIEIEASKKWSIEASKANFENFKQEISFDDGEAEKSYNITLFEKGKAPKPDDKDKTAAADPKDKKDEKPTGDQGTATLNINSIPPSNCILDGRPLGSTPKAGVTVPPGSHTVIFVHPEKGKKTAGVTVKAGETKAVGVKFD